MDETQVSAGWHSDPSGEHQLRYWDGALWTEHVSNEGVQSIAPLLTKAEISAARREEAKSASREKKEQVRSEKTAAREEAKAAAAARSAAQKSERAAARAVERNHVKSNPAALFAGALLRGGVLNYQGKKIDMTDAQAEATLGAPSNRSTFTRMGAGALIAGPLGLVAGAVVKKNTSRCYVTIETPDGVVVVDGKAKDYPEAVKFADAVNRSKR